MGIHKIRYKIAAVPQPTKDELLKDVAGRREKGDQDNAQVAEAAALQGAHHQSQYQLAHPNHLRVADEYGDNRQERDRNRDGPANYHRQEDQDESKHRDIQQCGEQQTQHQFGAREWELHQLGNVQPLVGSEFEQGQHYPQQVNPAQDDEQYFRVGCRGQKAIR